MHLLMMKKIKHWLIRYYRIIKHLIQFAFNRNYVYYWEVEHYYYMKQFKQIKL